MPPSEPLHWPYTVAKSGNLEPEQIGNLEPEQIGNLEPEQIGNLEPEQIEEYVARGRRHQLKRPLAQVASDKLSTPPQ